MNVSVLERGTYVFGPFELDPIRRTLFRDGNATPLSGRLFETLLYLVQHSGRLIGRDELLNAVWHGRLVEDSNLQKAVSALRKALQTDGAADAYIVTVSGYGFRFSAPVTFEPYKPSAAASFEPLTCQAKPDGLWRGFRNGPGRRLDRRWLAAMLLLAVVVTGWRLLPRRAADTPFQPPPHSVAVLAFANMSGDEKDDYFSDGLADELINTLGGVAGLRVAARTSAFSYKGKNATVGEVARRLNVAAVLEGSVRRDPQRVHISVRLIDARTGFLFWSRSYDRDRSVGDISAVQGEIAENVATSLEVSAMGTDAAKLIVGGTRNAHAFDAYLRGLKNNQEAEEAHARQAIADFSSAIKLDPSYARAFAGRALARNFLVVCGYEANAEEDKREAAAAVADADRAIGLAPDLAETHRVKSLILFYALEFRDSAKELARAVEVAPHDVMVEDTDGTIEVRLGHAGLAMTASRSAVELDPLNPSSYQDLGRGLFWTRHFDEALEAFDHALAIDGQPSRMDLSWTAFTYLAKGDAVAAERICTGGSAWSDTACLAIAYHALGRQREADEQLAKLRLKFGNRAAYIYAQICAQWGQPAQALRWLEIAYTLKDTGLTELKVSPFLDPIREFEGFKAIEKRLDFPP